jgi:hypothetical protein
MHLYENLFCAQSERIKREAVNTPALISVFSAFSVRQSFAHGYEKTGKQINAPPINAVTPVYFVRYFFTYKKKQQQQRTTKLLML